MNARSAKHEWVGGRIVAPFYVTEDTPFRPVIILWLEMPEGLVVHHELIAPGDPELSFGATFLAATAKPFVGPPRRPGTIRVSDPELAEQVRAVAPEIPVVVAPTPEVLDVLEFMMEHPPDEDTSIPPSYLQDGRVRADAVGLLFDVARRLKKVAPWKSMADAQLVRVDIPRYGVEAACLSVIGALRESIGLLLFPSLQGYRNFVEAAHLGVTSERTFDVGTSWMALTFELRRELPETMLREVSRHGWARQGETRFPVVQHRDSDATERPISDDEVAIMTICAGGFAEFFTENRQLFSGAGQFEPVCMGYSDPEDVEIRFTYPFEAAEEFEVNIPRSSRSSSQGRERAPSELVRGLSSQGRESASREFVQGLASQGRNDPCPCGSGKKYKRCCLTADRAAASERSDAERDGRREPIEAAPFHQLDRALVDKMSGFARGRFGRDWLSESAAAGDDALPQTLLMHWRLYHLQVEGAPIAEWFGDACADELHEEEAAWLRSSQNAWLSIWEVVDLDRGRSLLLRDLLTGEKRMVWETSASESLSKRDAILTRVVDHHGITVICGMHDRALPPRSADALVKEALSRLRRKAPIPVERLREEPIGRFLFTHWDAKLEELMARPFPALANTDGDRLLETVDHFDFAPADRQEIERRLASEQPEEEPPIDEADGSLCFVFTRSGDSRTEGLSNTVIARVFVEDSELRIATNSIARADSMKLRLGNALGSLIRHRRREHTDPVAELRGVRDRKRSSPAERAFPAAAPGGTAGGALSGRASVDGSSVRVPEGAEIDAAILEMKAKHYADWADHPLPALGGLTPRAAAKTKTGRKELDLLLREVENMESRAPAGQRYDFSSMRHGLGLDT